MKKKCKFWQGAKIRKKILFVVLIVVFILFLLPTIKIFQIRHSSILSEDAIKSFNEYDTVFMYPGVWWGGRMEPLNQKDLIRLYFILGSTRKYQPEKHQKYLPDGKILKGSHITFHYDEQYSDDVACFIRWEYENNTLIAYGNEDDRIKAKRYYIDQKHAQMLHKLFEKYGV